MQILNCIVFLILSGILVFFIGRIFPRKWIKVDKFPFKSFKFEKGGKIYDKLKIKNWKTKIPDASVIIGKIFPKFLPKKRIEGDAKQKVEVLVKETCVAESTHIISALLGLWCIKISKRWGWIASCFWILFNLPYIIIQRYNRPRLIKTCERYKTCC